MVGHKICLDGKTWKIVPKLSLLSLIIWSTEYLMIFVKKMDESVKLYHCQEELSS